MEKKRALIAMSGGVDSSVAAYLMQKRGYECNGATMKLYDNEDVGIDNSHTCCSANDIEDARAVAFKLGMKYYVFNFTDDFNEKVISKFVNSYINGSTPNPCIDCNRYMKFEKFSHRAEELGYDVVVTGHYARIEEKDGRFLLRKAVNIAKDQSYVLYSMSQKELEHTVFPLGEISDKDEVRRIAEENGLINADKPDSQDICFVPDGDYAKVIEHYSGRTFPEGDYLDVNGNVLGKHKGIIHYTIGQRRGLGIALGKHMFVVDKDAENNTVTLGDKEDLLSDGVVVESFNWIMFSEPQNGLKAGVKTRYNQKTEAACTLYVDGDKVRIVYDEPQKKAAKGQAAVVYIGDYVVGGGIIV